MKKTIIIFTVFVLTFSISGCGKKQASITINTVPQNASVCIDGDANAKSPVENYSISPGKHKIVVSEKGYETTEKEIAVNSSQHINLKITLKKISEKVKVVINTNGDFPVVVDGHCTGKSANKPIFVTKGTHVIQLINEPGGINKPYSLIGTFDIEKDTLLTEKDFRKEPSQSDTGMIFPVTFTGSVPVIRCCSAAAITYPGIYAGETVDLQGFTIRKIKAFYIVFPSGKKVEIQTKAGNCDCCANSFEKEVTFDEIGKYEIKNKRSSEDFISEHFNVFYKPQIVSSVKTVKELFPFSKNYMEDAIVVIEGEKETVKLLITDANGKIMRNTPIGRYGLKTDENGIVTFNLTGSFGIKNSIYGCCGEVFINGKSAPVLIYGGLLANLVRKVSISKKYAKKINGNVYVSEKMILPCLFGPPETITVNSEKYVNITEMISHPELFPRYTVKENKNAFVVYGLMDMVP